MFGKVHVGWAIGIVYIAISKNIVQAHAPKAMAVAPSLFKGIKIYHLNQFIICTVD
jgi:hypothetical protein